jgi:DNA modification methylase
MHRLINADCLKYLKATEEWWSTCIADPPDNIGLGYDTYRDRHPDEEYVGLLYEWLNVFIRKAKTVWFSYNSKWTFEIGAAVKQVIGRYCGDVEAKPCVQVFTFGQHNHRDLGNNHRPLLRLRWHDAPLLPDAIRVPSWRQENGDKRADPRGRVPGDVFDFTRVVGNSKQRRPWHPTQLNEGLVERCIRLTTLPGESVLDPFAGTGTTLRVCRQTGNPCTLIEIDRGYCEKIAEEHGMMPNKEGWSCSS